MLDRGRIHQGHAREIRDVSTCTAQHVGAARRSIWRDVTLPWQRPHQRSGFMAWRHVAFTEKKTYPLQTCYDHNMLSLLHAVCLKVLVFFFPFFTVLLLLNLLIYAWTTKVHIENFIGFHIEIIFSHQRNYFRSLYENIVIQQSPRYTWNSHLLYFTPHN